MHVPTADLVRTGSAKQLSSFHKNRPSPRPARFFDETSAATNPRPPWAKGSPRTGALQFARFLDAQIRRNDGNQCGSGALLGVSPSPDHPFYNDHGLVVVFSVNGTDLAKVAEAKIGRWN
jgi:hypothetical protein